MRSDCFVLCSDRIHLPPCLTLPGHSLSNFRSRFGVVNRPLVQIKIVLLAISMTADFTVLYRLNEMLSKIAENVLPLALLFYMHQIHVALEHLKSGPVLPDTSTLYGAFNRSEILLIERNCLKVSFQRLDLV